MKNTKNLGLPIYDNPKSDLFKISDVNSAHTIIDETYETMKNAKDHIVEIDENIPIKNADAEIVDARRGKSTLGEKIREIDSSLENKANKNEVFSMANMGQDIREALTGGSVAVIGKDMVLNENLTINCVDYYNAKFFDDNNKNLLDRVIKVQDYFPNPGNGKLQSSSGYDCTDFININPSSEFTVNFKGHICFYNSNKVFTRGINASSITTVPYIFSSNNDEYFIKISVHKTSGYNFDYAILNYGSEIRVPYIKEKHIKIGFESIKNKALASQMDFIQPSKNLFRLNSETINGYPHPSTGVITTHDSYYLSEWITVKENTEYVQNFGGHIAFYDKDKKFLSGIHKDNYVALDVIVTPPNATYVLTSLSTSSGYNINTAQFEEGTTLSEYTSFGSGILDTNKVKINVQSSSVQADSKYKGLKMNFLGDSITASGTYLNNVKNTLGLSEVRNYGVGGTTLTSNSSNGFLDRYLSMDNDADIIYVMGGTNDFGKLVALGEFDSTDTSTFTGSLKKLIEGLCLKYPKKIIIFGTLPQRFHLNQSTQGWLNNIGLHPRDYANRTIEVCREYGIPCVDIYGNMGLNEFNHEQYLSDRIHPTNLGYKKISDLICGKLNSI